MTRLFNSEIPGQEYPAELFWLSTVSESGKFGYSSDTYFNRFPAHVIGETLKNDLFVFTFDSSSVTVGSLKLVANTTHDRLILREWLLGRDVSETISYTFNGSGLLGVWVELELENQVPIEVLNFSFSTDLEANPDFRLCIGVCTLTEAEFVSKNVATILNTELPEGVSIDRVLVVDQGNQTFNWGQDYPEITLIRQENLGGSGGFSRVFHEFTNLQKNSSGLVIFDGDIDFHPLVIQRVAALASLCGQNQAIATQMMNMRVRHEILADNEIISLTTLWSHPNPSGRTNFHGNHANVLSSEGNLLAWWFAYLPRKAIEESGLPFPFFIHWDDQEYSFRLLENNVRVVTVPGLGVWHEPFDSKHTSGWVSYFDIRNALIGGSLHKATQSALFLKALRDSLACLFSHRYEKLNLAIKAIEDFLNGPKKIDFTGNQRQKVVEYIRGLELSGAPTKSFVNDAEPINTQNESRFSLLIFAGARLFYKGNGSRSILTSSRNPVSSNLLRYSRIIILGRYGGISEILEFDAVSYRIGLFRVARTMLKMLLRGRSTAREWRAFQQDLQSVQSWTQRWL